MFAYDLYVCYSSDDRPRVAALARQLQAAGLRVWFDDWEILPGDDIYLKVEAGLSAARTLLLCITARALASQWVQMERASTLFRDPQNKQRAFVPVLLEDCTLPPPLARYKHFDLRHDGKAQVDALVRVLRRILGGDAQPAPPVAGEPAAAAPAPEPEPERAAAGERVLYERGMTRAVLTTVDGVGEVVTKELRGVPDESRRLLASPDYAELVGARLVEAPEVPDDGPVRVRLRYVPGWSLADVVTPKNRVRGALLDDIVVAVLQQLRPVHRRGFVHRDVTPGNVVLGIEPLAHDARRGKVAVQLIDFESACRSGEPQTPFGVFGYTPGEQIDGRAVPASDLFALVGTAWFLSTGQRPSASRWTTDERAQALGELGWGLFTELELIGHQRFEESWLERPEQRPRDADELFADRDLSSRHFPPTEELGTFELPDGWRIRMQNLRYVAERD